MICPNSYIEIEAKQFGFYLNLNIVCTKVLDLATEVSLLSPIGDTLIYGMRKELSKRKSQSSI